MRPYISVLIPVYNAASYLPATLDSCLRQSFSNIEVITVDDGSLDHSVRILEEYARQDPRMKVVRQPNQGANAARKNAVEKACGEYVFFLDADDLLPQDALQNLWIKACETDDDIVIGGFCFQGKRTKSIVLNASPFGAGKVALLCSTLSGGGIAPSLSAKLIRRTLLSKVQWVEDLLIGEDSAVIFQLIDQTEKVSFVKKVVYIYIQHENSISHRLSPEARTSIIRFCLWSEAFFEARGYFENEQFGNCYAEHAVAACYRFFREGGALKDFPVFVGKVHSCYLKNKEASRRTPLWRTGLLKIYFFCPLLGEICRNILQTNRKVIRKLF